MRNIGKKRPRRNIRATIERMKQERKARLAGLPDLIANHLPSKVLQIGDYLVRDGQTLRVADAADLGAREDEEAIFSEAFVPGDRWERRRWAPDPLSNEIVSKVHGTVSISELGRRLGWSYARAREYIDTIYGRFGVRIVEVTEEVFDDIRDQLATHEDHSENAESSGSPYSYKYEPPRTGARYGSGVVVGRDDRPDDPRHTWWSLVCDCGVEFTARGDNLSSGRTTSCGCFADYVRTDRRELHRRSGGDDDADD